MEKVDVRVAVVCINAENGSPEVPVFTVKVTPEQYDLGEHYDAAKKLAAEIYEGPFICFDSTEIGALERALVAMRG